MITSLRVGQTVVVDSHPQDAGNNENPNILPGFAGNNAVQWLPQTSGIVSHEDQNANASITKFTALAVGSTVVNILGFTPAGVPKQTPFTINVTAGDLDHFNPIADPPQG